jgi:hypothetical protein
MSVVASFALSICRLLLPQGKELLRPLRELGARTRTLPRWVKKSPRRLVINDHYYHKPRKQRITQMSDFCGYLAVASG